MKEIPLQNIEISSEIIVFDQQKREGHLTIYNKHSTISTIFKIKATKLKVIDVKPAKGHIKPQTKEVIHFKVGPSITKEVMENVEKNDRFLLQFLNVPNSEATREEVETIWAAYKNGSANLQKGYGCYKVEMNLTGQKKMTTSRQVKRSSQRAETLASGLTQMHKSKYSASENDFNKLTSRIQIASQNSEEVDLQLSNQYSELKRKEQELIEKREKLFMHNSSKPKSQSSSQGLSAASMLILVLLLTLSFLVGNYIRSGMVKIVHHH